MSDEDPAGRNLLSSIRELFGDPAKGGPERPNPAAGEADSGPEGGGADQSDQGTEPTEEPDGDAVGQKPQGETAAGPSAEETSPTRSPLLSPAAAVRRAALEEVIERGLSQEEVGPVERLLFDPERDIRVLALEALSRWADQVEAAAIRQALHDPSDEVRAEAVRLAVARRSLDLEALVAALTGRAWPLAQGAALEELPARLAQEPPTPEVLTTLLGQVGTLEPPPAGGEAAGLADVAAAIGDEHLIEALGETGEVRVGAIRLLLARGSREGLRALAALEDDPVGEARAAARAAGAHLADRSDYGTEPAEAPPPTPRAAPERVDDVEAQVVAGLARALDDPEEGVRRQARRALESVQRATLVAWVRAELEAGDAQEAAVAARVAEAAPLPELAGHLLRRAAVEPETRGAASAALRSFGLSAEELVELARSLEPSRRPEAVRLLWQMLGQAALPALRGLLEDSSGAVRVAALEAFGEASDPAAVQIAQETMASDSSPVVRAMAIRVIARGGLAERLSALGQALADPDPDVRATGIELLAPGMGRQPAPHLISALGDEDRHVWQAAVRHLVRLPDRDLGVLWTAVTGSLPERREHLIGELEQTSVLRLASLALDHVGSADESERALAVSLAGRAGTAECLAAIVAALSDPGPEVRRVAASTLAALRSPEAIPSLSNALLDPDPEVRRLVVRALSVIDDNSVLDPIVSALKDPDAEARELSGEALLRWRSPAVARRLVEALGSPSLRRSAGEVLARMGQAALDPLIGLLSEDDPEMSGTVGKILETIAEPETFLERLGSMDPAERLRAVQALGALGGDVAIEGLTRAVADPVEEVRIRAVELLGLSGDPRALVPVRGVFLGDPVPAVVVAAEDALRRLQGEGEDPPTKG